MLKKHLLELIVILVIVTLLLSSCDLYLPKKDTIYITELLSGSEYELNTISPYIGNLIVERRKYGTFIPDEEEVLIIDCKINSVITELLVRVNDHIEKGQLIAKANSEEIAEQIFYQEIYTKQAKIRYKKAQEQFEDELIKQYQLELYNLIAITSQYQLDDYRELYNNSFIYAPDEGEIIEIFKSVGDQSIGNIALVCNKANGILRISTEKEIDEELIYFGLAEPKIISSLDYKFMGLKNEDEIKIKVINQIYDGMIFRDINTFILQYGDDFEMNYIDILFKNVPDSVYFLQEMTAIYVEVQLEDILLLETVAIYSDVDDKKYVYFVENNKTIIREIEIGLSSNGYTQVLSGLVEGDKVFIVK
ncbi:MAG: hypothetical protein KAG94_00950 [Clostridiales bacterium]|nr:hypothetical protein [Clostridiales bacterium]